jgi:hypothetical protein
VRIGERVGYEGPSLIGHCETRSTKRSAPRALSLTSFRSPVVRIRSTGRQLAHGPRSSASCARSTTVSDQLSLPSCVISLRTDWCSGTGADIWMDWRGTRRLLERLVTLRNNLGLLAEEYDSAGRK